MKRKEPPRKAKLRRLARLHLAHWDVDTARQMAEAAAAANLDKHDPAAWAFHYAVVITYGRPFSTNDSVGKLEGKWSKFEDPQLEANHLHFLAQRAEVVAHAELRWRPIVFAPAGTKLPSNVITVNPVTVGARMNLEAASYPRVLDLCADLHPRLTAAFDELFMELFPQGVQEPVPLLPTPEGEPGMHITVN